MKRKRGYSRWSEDEEKALRVGVERYGEGKWKRILCDPDLSKFFVDRSNVDLKDKWRTLLCADKTRPESGSDVEASDEVEKLLHSDDLQAGPLHYVNDADAQESAAHSLARHPEASSSPRSSPLRIHPLATRGEKALSAALSAAKRRHNGTTGERAYQQLQSEMLLEVWKVLNAHEGAAVLRRLGHDIAPLRRLLSLSRGQTRLDAKAFYTDVLGLVNSARHKQIDSPEDSVALVSEFEAFIKRQFDVLCLADEATDQALKPAICSASDKEHPRLRATSCENKSSASLGQAAPKAPGRNKAKVERIRSVEEELMAADVLQMIRGGTSSAENSQDLVAASDLLDAVESKKPRKMAQATTPSVAMKAKPTPPILVDALKSSPQLTPLAGAITVPEGCGLVSTSVSAALDKATELLNNTGNESLLPVKELLHPAAHTALQPAVKSLTQAASAAPSASSPLSLSPGLLTCPLGSSPLAVPPVPSCQQILIPSCALQPYQGLGGLLPACAIGSGADAKGRSGIPVVGSEQWYPAYLAWVYSAMVSNATCK